jgi:hypothetical protein
MAQRVQADLPLVFHCMKGSKPMNASYSTTPKGERLTDAQCVNRLCARITKAVIYIRTAARYRMVYGMPEPYAVNVACTVLRRGRASNRSSLFDNSLHRDC